MIQAVHHIGINCRDLDRMVRFYSDAFGFMPVVENFSWERGNAEIDHLVDVRDSAAKMKMLRAGGLYLELFQYSHPPAESVEPKRPFDFGYTHLCVDVTDFESDMAHLAACGMTFNDRAYHGSGSLQALYGYDPEGNIIELKQGRVK